MSPGLRLEAPDVPRGSVPEPALRSVQLDPQLIPAFREGAAVDRLRHPEAVAVTTGQQPGLFGGPLYTLHKALAARGMALELERRWERPVVPVFWVAGDDHDWTEASTATWWAGSDDVRRWQLDDRPPTAPQDPMSSTVVPVLEVASARASLARDLPLGPDRDHVLEWIDRHWHPSATMASAFTGAMHELLDPLGIAILDPTHHAFKVGQRSILLTALERSAEIDAVLAALPDAGTGIGAGDGATLVFLTAAEGRDRLVRTGDDLFVTRRSGESFTMADLDRLLRTAPERFSANVLLRPVVEAALLPTVAYVAGPGEARYLTGQAAALYRMFDTDPQAVIPRWTGTVIDATTDRLLGRLDLVATDVLAGDPDLERAIVMRDMPTDAVEALARLETAITESSAVLANAGERIDAVLDRAVATRANKMLGVARDLERLLVRHLKRRDEIAWAQYQRLRRRLVPDDSPQERVISVVAALGVWGPGWIDLVAEATSEWARLILEASPRGT